MSEYPKTIKIQAPPGALPVTESAEGDSEVEPIGERLNPGYREAAW